MDQYGHLSKVHSIRTAALLLVTVLFISGCSSTRLAYRYADWGIVWWVEDFISLSQAQEQRLNADIERLKQWHCSTELPRYRAWLNNIDNDLVSGKPNPEAVSRLQDQLVSFFPPLMQSITPVAISLLSSLSDEQVRELAGNMEENHKKLKEEFLAGDAESIAQARAERTMERAERWLGNLNDSQQAIINIWSESRTGQTKIWLEGRRNWQKALLVALENRREAAFEHEISELINNPEAGRGDAYAQRTDEGMAAMSSLIQDLLQASQPSQRDHLAQRTSELNGDFKALTCKPGSEVAVQSNQ
ncbi:DUF3549 domain-containing protein [Marinobacter salexigens]|uniref:DUF3549 domain-containing protein n=1 Tax=Marinobacter salexigens TaxID=1925763 RepID=A0ABS6AF14_9GAMM|nr:DUF3549 domain-containing protein [Marinobacter salexigens]